MPKRKIPGSMREGRSDTVVRTSLTLPTGGDGVVSKRMIRVYTRAAALSTAARCRSFAAHALQPCMCIYVCGCLRQSMSHLTPGTATAACVSTVFCSLAAAALHALQCAYGTWES
jgi:hypothetical protein